MHTKSIHTFQELTRQAKCGKDIQSFIFVFTKPTIIGFISFIYTQVRNLGGLNVDISLHEYNREVKLFYNVPYTHLAELIYAKGDLIHFRSVLEGDCIARVLLTGSTGLNYSDPDGVLIVHCRDSSRVLKLHSFDTYLSVLKP